MEKNKILILVKSNLFFIEINNTMTLFSTLLSKGRYYRLNILSDVNQILLAISSNESKLDSSEFIGLSDILPSPSKKGIL